MARELAKRETAGGLATLADCEISRAGLVIPAETPIERWQEIGATLKDIDGAVQWWIGDWLNFGERGYGEMYSQALEETDYDEGTLRNAKWVSAQYELSRRRDNLSFGHHQTALGAPDPQAALQWCLDNPDERGRPASIKALREHIRGVKIKEQTPDLPAGKYRVLYADPPWKYNDELIEGYGAAEHHYQTLTLPELQDLRDKQGQHVRDLAHTNAVLFLWATSPLLDDALALIAAWGFEYKTSFVWDKVKHNFGHYNSVRHELLLVCTRGSCVPDSDKLIDSVQVIERTEKHSEKPEEFRQIIDTLYVPPKKGVDRIELFRRGAAPKNWHVWGNETAS